MLQWRASAGSQTAQVIHQKSSIQQMQTSPCPSAALTVLQRSSCSHHLHCLHCLPTSLFPPPHPSIHAATLVSSHSCHLPSSLPHLPLPPSPYSLLLHLLPLQLHFIGMRTPLITPPVSVGPPHQAHSSTGEILFGPV